MTVEEDGVPVARADPLDFRSERIVVGPEISRNAMYDSSCAGAPPSS
jgi:hypothetical protein